MTEQFVPAALEERRPIDASHVGDPNGRGTGIDDPRALTILTTEHWGLLSARSLVYNEAFARAGMFLAFLSATLVVLGLISAIAGFGDTLLVIAAFVLALDLFIGLASLARIQAASVEDIRYLQGMNRIRHAYLEIVPELERYFITSGYDDFASVAAFYGPGAAPSPVRGVIHGLTTAPGMIGVICAAVAGALVAVIVVLASHAPIVAVLAGLAGFVGTFGAITISIVRQVNALFGSLNAVFPRPEEPGRP